MAKATYQVTTKTDELYAVSSTKSKVSIQLVGQDGDHTEWVLLNKLLRRNFQSGKIDVFIIEAIDVGRPVIVRIKLDKRKPNSSWGCEYITVKYGEFTDEFPVYEWVSETIDVVEGTAILPQNTVNPYLKNARDDEKGQNQLVYSWQKRSDAGEYWKLPRYQACQTYEGLPQMFKKQDARVKRKEEVLTMVKRNELLMKFKTYFFSINEPNDFKKLIYNENMLPQLPSFMEKWNEDEEFGRQMLNGITPNNVVRCLKIPPFCNITEDHVKGILPVGKALKKEILNGHIYMKDFSYIFAGISRNVQVNGEPLYCPNAVALFYSNEDGKFLPIAIQLERDNEESVFTPLDEQHDWELAKMYFRCAEHMSALGEQSILRDVMEPVAVSLFRYFPRCHPVYKLLRPHLQGLPGINQINRDQGSSPNVFIGLDDQDMRNKYYENFDFADLIMPQRFRKFGVHDRDLLPNYFFRDDALLLWTVVEKYASKVISHYYKYNQDVVEDKEIQTWIADLALDGYAWFDGYARGCPGSFKTVDDLKSFATAIIYTTSVHHAALHYPAYDYFKFIPNCPSAMRLPVHKTGEASHQRILDSLPDLQLATSQINHAFTEYRHVPNEIQLGEFYMKLFTEPEVLKFQDEFLDEMMDATCEIRKRNENVKIPYEYLLPENIPNGIQS
ncbi:allene oxide synthase-lipoxygenase protein-like [Styela clava]